MEKTQNVFVLTTMINGERFYVQKDISEEMMAVGPWLLITQLREPDVRLLTKCIEDADYWNQKDDEELVIVCDVSFIYLDSMTGYYKKADDTITFDAIPMTITYTVPTI